MIPKLLSEQQVHQRAENSQFEDDLLIENAFEHEDIGLRYIRHHLLDNYDDSKSYEGAVRQITFGKIANVGKNRFGASGLLRMNADQSRLGNDSQPNVSGKFRTNIGHGAINDRADSGGSNSTRENRSKDSNASESGGYSTALSVTVAIGCSLLILNMLIFGGVYYQLHRHGGKKSRRNKEASDESETEQMCPPKSKPSNRCRSNSTVQPSQSGQPIYCLSSPTIANNGQTLSDNVSTKHFCFH